jgi:hypothetical protein
VRPDPTPGGTTPTFTAGPSPSRWLSPMAALDPHTEEGEAQARAGQRSTPSCERTTTLGTPRPDGTGTPALSSSRSRWERSPTTSLTIRHAPYTVSTGRGFVDDGRGHVARNETDQPAQDVSVITAPVGGPFRTDLDADTPTVASDAGKPVEARVELLTCLAGTGGGRFDRERTRGRWIHRVLRDSVRACQHRAAAPHGLPSRARYMRV